MENTSSIFRRIVGELLSVQEEPVMQLTAKEYIWGYRDELLHTLKIDFPEIITDDQVSAFNAAVNLTMFFFVFFVSDESLRQY